MRPNQHKILNKTQHLMQIFRHDSESKWEKGKKKNKRRFELKTILAKLSSFQFTLTHVDFIIRNIAMRLLWWRISGSFSLIVNFASFPDQFIELLKIHYTIKQSHGN